MRTLLKSILSKLGFEISKFNLWKMRKLLQNHEIELILDVGAFDGRFGRYMRYAGYKGNILSFEPLRSAYSKITRVSKRDRLWDVAPRAAIGNEEGEIEINISKNSYSSSILKMLNTHLESAPDSAYIGKERVKITKLDTIALPYTKDKESIFLKIDTQGFEEPVLDGATVTMSKVKLLQVELSLIPLYEGQKLYIEMIEKIYKLGYELYSILPVFADKKTGKLLQFDGLFLKRQ